VTRLSGRLARDLEDNAPRRACVQFGLSGQMLDAQAMRAACLSLSGELNIDVAVQEDNAYRRNRRLVCFDMDSTLIEQEVIDELALEAGVGDKSLKLLNVPCKVSLISNKVSVRVLLC
jgi:phosphoserine phosphatase